MEEVQKTVELRPGDFVVLRQLQNFQIRELSLDNDGIHVTFHGRVGELRTGPARSVEERLPSVLEWVYHRQAWLLYLNAVVLIGTTVVAMLERFQVLRKGG
jgi:hypothetical protein